MVAGLRLCAMDLVVGRNVWKAGKSTSPMARRKRQRKNHETKKGGRPPAAQQPGSWPWKCNKDVWKWTMSHWFVLHWPGWSRQTQGFRRSNTLERCSNHWIDAMMMYLTSSGWQELGPTSRCYEEVTCRRTKHVILLHLRGWKRHDVMPWVSHPQLPELLHLDGEGKEEVLSDGFSP